MCVSPLPSFLNPGQTAKVLGDLYLPEDTLSFLCLLWPLPVHPSTRGCALGGTQVQGQLWHLSSHKRTQHEHMCSKFRCGKPAQRLVSLGLELLGAKS